MKNRIKSFKSFDGKKILESSNYRIYSSISKYQCVIISAFRGNLTKDENLKRDKNLKLEITKEGYGITEIKGVYIENYKSENARRVFEQSLFVVNKNDDPNFRNFMIKLGEKYDQDSILIIPEGVKGAFLYGTNDTGYPGKYEMEEVGKLKMKEDGEFYSKKSGGIKFTFTKGLPDIPSEFDPMFTKIS